MTKYEEEDLARVRYQASDKKRPLMVVELICQSDGLPMPVPEFQVSSRPTLAVRLGAGRSRRSRWRSKAACGPEDGIPADRAS